jgi:hypothetical protein
LASILANFSANALAFASALAFSLALFALKQGTLGWCGQCFSPHILQVGTNFAPSSPETRLSVTLLTSIQNSQKRRQFPFWLPAGSENQLPLLLDTFFSIWAMVFQELIFYRTFPPAVNPNAGHFATFFENQTKS